MIINVWRPSSKSVNKKSIIIRYDMCDIDDMYKKGSTSLKIIYKCDGLDCKFPNKIHSISRHHLNINRSINMHDNLQICRSCQTSGSKNPKYGDNRTWDQVMGKERSKEMKNRYSNGFTGINNPSKCDDVKRKKNQIIINFESVSDLCKKNNYVLNSLSGDNKSAKISVTCHNNHTLNILYSSFVVKYSCRFCFYDSIRVSSENIEKFENYSKVVRYRSITSFKRYRSIIDPLGLKLKDSNKYHIDHIYSVADGFRNNIDPMIVSSMINLRVITSGENFRKGSKSDIKLEELLEKYSKLLVNNLVIII